MNQLSRVSSGRRLLGGFSPQLASKYTFAERQRPKPYSLMQSTVRPEAAITTLNTRKCRPLSPASLGQVWVITTSPSWSFPFQKNPPKTLTIKANLANVKANLCSRHQPASCVRNNQDFPARTQNGDRDMTSGETAPHVQYRAKKRAGPCVQR